MGHGYVVRTTQHPLLNNSFKKIDHTPYINYTYYFLGKCAPLDLGIARISQTQCKFLVLGKQTDGQQRG